MSGSRQRMMALKKKRWLVSQVSRGAWKEVVYSKKGLGGGALLIAFLAKVSTKFDLIAHATEDKVA
jgi:hypothetical protein